MQENDYNEENQFFEKEAKNMADMLLANKKAIHSLLNERKPFNYLCKYFGISNQAMRIRLFNLVYFQTAKQVIEEEKEVKNIFIYSQQTIANYIYKNYKLSIK